MRFTVNADNVSTGAVADTFTTELAMRAADTAGYRFRLRSLSVGPADDVPGDLNLAVQVKRVDDVSAGGAGTSTAVTPVPKDSLSRASVITAGKAHTVEPTTYGDPLWQVDINRRNSFIKEWAAEDAPVANRDQLLGVLLAPRTAAAAVVSIAAEFEEF